MSYSVNWITKVITIPRADLSLVSGSTYKLDLELFKIEIRRLEANEGLWAPQVLEYKDTSTLSGVTYAGGIEIVNGYTITFEYIDPLYAVSCVGANHNLGDVQNINGVQLIINNAAGLIQSSDLAFAAFDGKVWVNTYTGVAGTTGVLGNRQNPVDCVCNAITIGERESLDVISINGEVELDGEDVENFTLMAQRSKGNIVFIASMVNGGDAYFTDLTVSGDLTGGVRFTTCVLGALTGFDGGAKNSLITGGIDVVGTGANYFTECDTYTTSEDAYKEISINDKLVNFIRCEGRYKITNKTGTDTTAINMVGGSVLIDSSCTAGQIIVSGTAEVIDESGSGCEIINNTTEALIFAQAVEGSLDLADTLKLMLAATTGSSAGAGTNTFEYKSVDGATTRIRSSFDANGNRQITLLDAS